MSFLNGKGTYLSGAAIILATLGETITKLSASEPVDWNQFVVQMAAGFGMIRLRRAVGVGQ